MENPGTASSPEQIDELAQSVMQAGVVSAKRILWQQATTVSIEVHLESDAIEMTLCCGGPSGGLFRCSLSDLLFEPFRDTLASVDALELGGAKLGHLSPEVREHVLWSANERLLAETTADRCRVMLELAQELGIRGTVDVDSVKFDKEYFETAARRWAVQQLVEQLGESVSEEELQLMHREALVKSVMAV